MDVEHILRVIKQGEGLTVEFKQANAFFKLRPTFQMSRNANKPHLYGSLAPANCESFPKNPHLAKFFVQLGRAEELGTGIRKIFKYSVLYSGIRPIVDENDVFVVHVPLLEEIIPPIIPPIIPTIIPPIKKRKQLTYIELKIISLVEKNPKISMAEMGEKLGVKKEVIKYQLNKLKQANKIRREGNLKGGVWITINDK